MIFHAVASIPIKLSLEKRIAPQLVALDAYYDTFPVVGLEVVGLAAADAPGQVAFAGELLDAQTSLLTLVPDLDDTLILEAEEAPESPSVAAMEAEALPADDSALALLPTAEELELETTGLGAEEPAPPPPAIEGLEAGVDDDEDSAATAVEAECGEENDAKIEGLEAEDEDDV